MTAPIRTSGWPAPPPLAGELVVAPLTSELLDLDLAAYRSSPKAISAHSAGRWPGADLSREEARRLLELHENEHATGGAFAYALLSADRSRELGCVYLRPLSPFLARTGTRFTAAIDPSRTAIATFWLIDDLGTRPSAVAVLSILRGWLGRWRAADPVYRCLPAESASVTALSEADGLSRMKPPDRSWRICGSPRIDSTGSPLLICLRARPRTPRLAARTDPDRTTASS